MVRSFGNVKPPLSAAMDFAHPLARGLVLAFPMNEACSNFLFNAADQQCYPPSPDRHPQGTTSDSQATITYDFVKWGAGLLGGQALNFTLGNTTTNRCYLQPAATTGYDTTSKAFSLQAWIQYYGAQSSTGTIFQRASTFGVDLHWDMSVLASNGHLRRYTGFDTGYVINKYQTYHVVYTFDAATSDTSGTETFYVNGQKIASQTGTVPASVTGTSANVYIGESNTAFLPWYGIVDWPCMWVSRTLTASDVEWLYAEPFAMFPDSPRRQAYFLAGQGPATRTVAIADNLGLQDSFVTTGIARTRLLSDNLGVSATPQIITRTMRGLTDNIGLNDSITDAPMIWHRAASDNLGLRDTFARLAPVARSIHDSLGVTESIARATPTNYRILSDNLGLNDTPRLGNIRSTNPQDNLGVSDVFSRSVQPYFRQFGDNLGLAEQIGRLQNAVRVLSDNLGVTDLSAPMGFKPIVLSDNLGVTDTQRTEPHYWARGVIDSLGLSDSVTMPSLITWPIALADNLALTDQISLANILLRLVADNLGLADRIPSSPMGWMRQLADNLGVTDGVQVLRATLRRLADNLGVTDQLGAGHVWALQILDYLALADSLLVHDVPNFAPQPTIVARWAIPQPAVGQHLWMVRGSDHVYLFVPDQGPTNIGGWDLRWELRPGDGSLPTIIKTTPVSGSTLIGGMVISDAINGLISLQLTWIDTLLIAMQAPPWYWELRRTDAGAESTLARGVMTLQQQWADDYRGFVRGFPF